MDDRDSWAQLARQVANGGYEQLSADERDWYCVGTLVQAIEHGGLISYYAGAGADHLPDCMAGLKRLKTGPIVTLLSMIGKLFPYGVPADARSRRAIIDSWPDDGSTDRMLALIEEQAASEVPFVKARLATFVEKKGLNC